jgi:hypothetical protein
MLSHQCTGSGARRRRKAGELPLAVGDGQGGSGMALTGLPYMCMITAPHLHHICSMARVCISLPDELVETLRETKPRHLGLSAHIRGLVYKGFEALEYEKELLDKISKSAEALATGTTSNV